MKPMDEKTCEELADLATLLRVRLGWRPDAARTVEFAPGRGAFDLAWEDLSPRQRQAAEELGFGSGQSNWCGGHAGAFWFGKSWAEVVGLGADWVGAWRALGFDGTNWDSFSENPSAQPLGVSGADPPLG